MPKLKYQITQLTSDHNDYCEKAIDLFHKTGGNGDIQIEDLKSSMNHPMCYVVGAFDKDKLIGVANAFVLRPDHLKFYDQFVPNFSSIYSQKIGGQINSVAVDPEYQGQGVGSSLLLARLDWLKSKRCEFVVAVSWDNKQKNSSRYVFEKFNFEKSQSIQNFYRDGLLKVHKSCPVCGTLCSCDAILFIKTL